MNTVKFTLSFIHICLISIALFSCSSTKKMVEKPNYSDSEAITELKSGLKFKTHFGSEGDMDIKATNISDNTLDLSELSIYIEQVGTKKYKAYTLQELQAADKLNTDQAMDLQLSLDERIESDFAGSENIYNVSIVYKSKSPLQNGDERNIYYISYKYTGK